MKNFILTVPLAIISALSFFSGTKISKAQNVYVDCNAFNGDLKAKCLRKQIKLLQQQVKKLEKLDTQIRDNSRKVDCAFQAAQLAISSPYKLTTATQKWSQYIVDKVVNDARQKSFRDDASCQAWMRDRLKQNFDSCGKWLDRNSVEVFKSGIPYTSNRGYLSSPVHCNFKQPTPELQNTNVTNESTQQVITTRKESYSEEETEAAGKNKSIEFKKIEFKKLKFKKLEFK